MGVETQPPDWLLQVRLTVWLLSDWVLPETMP